MLSQNNHEASHQNGDNCVLCDEPLDTKPTVKLRKKGSDSINQASLQRGDELQTDDGQTVHLECRRTYINPHCIEAALKRKACTEVTHTPKRTLRSHEDQFDFATHCIFCSQAGKYDWHTRTSNLIPVRTETKFQDAIKKISIERNDEWGMTVLSRLEFAGDCVAKDVVYHNTCSVNFRTLKQMPKSSVIQHCIKRQRVGRPEDEERLKIFHDIAMYVEEHNEEQLSVCELVNRMEQQLGHHTTPYSVYYMKKKLTEYFGQRVIIAELNGKADVVTLRETASSILQDFYHLPKLEDTHAEKLRIVETTAELIKSDIKGADFKTDVYPSKEEIESVDFNTSLLPPTLLLMLQKIINGKDSDLKIASIGQAIIQACRPRSAIAPLQIGLGIQMHHHFGSRFLIDSLNKHGFCMSYAEVKKFESNAAAIQGIDVPGKKDGHFLQFVADNVDHNLCTLDGFNTFHGMGILATSTPGTMEDKHVPRLHIQENTITDIAKIGIFFCKSEWNGLSSLYFEDLSGVDLNDSSDPTSAIDVLWKITWPLKTPRSSWSGFMQTVTKGSHPGVSSVSFLPMIDMSSSDPSCIYSTLKFVTAQATKQNSTPIITFDQPLWWKAKMIIANTTASDGLQSVILRLGAFHTEMSFLGCIGHIMTGSGLSDVFETIYAPNATVHMLTGKATARALRAHLITESALHAILVAQTFHDDKTEDLGELGEDPSPLIDKDELEKRSENTELKEVARLYEKLMSGERTIDDVSASTELASVLTQLACYEESLKTSRTSKLWIQYIDMIDLLRKFIKAERTGNWHLHLNSLYKMLPYFTASGHNLYAKSAWLYLQDMMKLAETSPEVVRLFEDGYHVVRRSDRYWAGLPTDLFIEQVLMRSLKSNGGLTRGSGMAESQRTLWLLSMPLCASINIAMQNFTGIAYATSDQHKDNSDARLQRDEKDLFTVVKFLLDRNPFSPERSLRNISTGETADKTVNVDEALHHGKKILDSMSGKQVLKFTFKKKDQVVTLAHKSAMQIDGQDVNIDPQLLFQRLIATAKNIGEDLSAVFQYELCNVPSALFETSGLARVANKPALAEALWTHLKKPEWQKPSEEINAHYVLDGGALLHRVVWPRGYTYDSILAIYSDYVTRRYGKPTIVFDGYEEGPSIKDTAHIRRSGAKGAKINFKPNMVTCTSKDDFLSNPSNKQRFIHLLGEELGNKGCTVKHAKGDADLLIVQTAVESSLSRTTILVGDDTDLLILLCYHAHSDSHKLFFIPEPKSNLKRNSKVWNINELRNLLGKDVCNYLLFAHALLGCDTTSRVFGIGKGMALKKLLNDKTFRDHAAVFTKESNKADIIRSGEAAMVAVYNGCNGTKLDSLRYLRFCEKVATNHTFVQPQTLPPTSSATNFHSQRVYFQVREWMGDRPVDMNPLQWGWENQNGFLVPAKMDKPPAPQQLLKVVHCNCKTDCVSSKCTCRKHGLSCSTACGECRGLSCANSLKADIDVVDQNS